MALGPENITQPVDGKEVSTEIKAGVDAIEAAFDTAIKFGQYTTLTHRYLNGVSIDYWFTGSFSAPLRDEVERRYLHSEKNGRWKLVRLLQTIVDRRVYCLTLIPLNPPERDRLRAEQYLNLLEEQKDRLFRATT